MKTGNWKLGTGNWELGTGNWELGKMSVRAQSRTGFLLKFKM
ncbi:hypothetical protein [Nonlabens antarcticus]|nr:hypothetical protein [Nonlabens antarcticus]